jgi:hypothetical protein
METTDVSGWAEVSESVTEPDQAAFMRDSILYSMDQRLGQEGHLRRQPRMAVNDIPVSGRCLGLDLSALFRS